jgi:hypothetical protein
MVNEFTDHLYIPLATTFYRSQEKRWQRQEEDGGAAEEERESN